MMKNALCCALLCLVGACAAPLATDPVATDPVADAQSPASAHDVRFDSRGVPLHGRMFVAQGGAPRPTVVIARGLPDLLGNLDVAMALRRAGFNVLSFNYRGCWGSGGVFTLMNAFEDVQAAVAFVRKEGEAGRMRIDPNRILLLGYSYGAPVVLKAAAEDPAIRAVASIDGTDMRANVAILRSHGQQAAAWLESLGMIRFESGRAFVEEVVAQADQWDPAARVAGLAGKEVLMIAATRGTLKDGVPRPSMEELFGAGSRVTALVLDTDHEFSDRRIALARAIVQWARATHAAEGL